MPRILLQSAITRWAEKDGNRPALTCDGCTITRRELEQESNRFARVFAQTGVRQRDFVVLFLPNGIQLLESVLAAVKLGAMVLPVSPKMPAPERNPILDLVKPALIVGLPALAYKTVPVVPEGYSPPENLPSEPLVDAEPHPWFASTSGGSTGRPKIIVNTQAGFIDPDVAEGRLAPEEVVLIPGPLYHGAPLNQALRGLAFGNHVIVMRGFEPEDILRDPANKEIKPVHLEPFNYPSEEEIESVGVRGIYLANFFGWNAREQTKLVIDKYNFETAKKRERTHHLYDKLDDIHANGAHDYLKYLKFGYGRATDDASTDIRNGLMTREEGISMVMKHDPVRPSDLDLWLRFVGMTEAEFIASVDHLRDPNMWEKDSAGKWRIKDSIGNHTKDEGVNAARLPLAEDRSVLMSHNQPSSTRDDHIPEDSEYIWL